MKSNLVKVAIALASVVFVLACQDLGTGAVGPDGSVPQFARGGEKGKPDNSKSQPPYSTSLLCQLLLLDCFPFMFFDTSPPGQDRWP